jgi:hypothetical protein
MTIDIKEQYIDKFEDFIHSLPKDAINVKKSLNSEIDKRVEEYKNGVCNTKPFEDGLDTIREKLVAKL